MKRATEALVSSAQQAKTYTVEEQSITVEIHNVKGMAQVLAAQEEIIRKEKELQEARRKLGLIHQKHNKYIKKDDGDDSSSSF